MEPSILDQFKQEKIHPILQQWEKLRDPDFFPPNYLHMRGFLLYDAIAPFIDKHIQDNKRSGQNGSSQIQVLIKRFLGGIEEEYEIDDCIRWFILYKAVTLCKPIEVLEKNDKATAKTKKLIDPEGVALWIIDAILEISPYLAFDNLQRGNVNLVWRKYGKVKCKFEKQHEDFKPEDSLKTVPLLEAAKCGSDSSASAIKLMIKHGNRLPIAGSPETSENQPLVEILRQKSSDRLSPKSALQLAVEAGEGGLETVKALLNYSAQIADTNDGAFKYAVKEGYFSIVDTFLEKDELRSSCVTEENIVQAIDFYGEDTSNEQIRSNRLHVVSTLFSHASMSGTITDEVIGKIIKHNLKSVWEKKSFSGENLYPPKLLHLAVLHQNAEFVEMLLCEYPDSVANQSDGHYPLWYNNSRSATLTDSLEKETNQVIRDKIVTAMIKSKAVDKMQELLRIFQQSNETVQELCFDLSKFNSKTYPLSKFVHSLIHHQDNPKLLSYERTIKYAEFPTLESRTETFGDTIDNGHKEVFQILDWLRSKNVQEIIDLKVPDRLVNPHNEVKIGQYVADFKVEVLNWRFLDMSITILKDEETKRRIRELYLYSSGKRAVVNHWLSAEGVPSLSNLARLEVSIIQELMPKEDCRETLTYIQDEFDTFERTVNEERRILNLERKAEGQALLQELRVNVRIQPWNPANERQADLEEISERAVPKLSQFIKSYHEYVQRLALPHGRPFRPIRVAVIDNGILSISPKEEGVLDFMSPQYPTENQSSIMTPDKEEINGHYVKQFFNGETSRKTLWSRIKAGRSFVDDNFRVSPWLFASDPHGTQMANLICAIDPWCDLYVAKVTEGRSGIIPARVERAIDWAFSQNVDIISMSFAIIDDFKQVKDACHRAADRGILLICSAHDEGLNITKAYPIDYSETIGIITCDEYGEVTRAMANSTYDYAIQGQGVAAGMVPFLESDDRISGSSVATAIAAGLCSLTLACSQIARTQLQRTDGIEEQNQLTRAKIIKHYFSKMLADGKRYILLEKFAEIDQNIKEGKNIDAEYIIKNFFNKEEQYLNST
ncbi:hypothetical protein J3F84DRAFT_368680 [Trichoderma pleuroticola]